MCSNVQLTVQLFTERKKSREKMGNYRCLVQKKQFFPAAATAKFRLAVDEAALLTL